VGMPAAACCTTEPPPPPRVAAGSCTQLPARATRDATTHLLTSESREAVNTALLLGQTARDSMPATCCSTGGQQWGL
jgi:hypothetical protein